MSNHNIDTIAEAVRYCRTQALLKGKPGKKISARKKFDVDHIETLETALDDIIDYLLHNYKLGDNPLPFLRRWFQYWEWKRLEVQPWINDDDLPGVVETVMANDYTFAIRGEPLRKVVVTASRIGGSKAPKRVLRLACLYHDTWPTKKLRESGCVVISGALRGFGNH